MHYCTTKALPASSFCTKHLNEYMASTSRLKRAVQLCDGMSADVRRIMAKDAQSAYSTAQDVWQDLDVVIRFGGVLDQISRCETELKRFSETGE